MSSFRSETQPIRHSFKAPTQYQALSYDDGTRHTFAMGADRLLTSPSDSVFYVWWEQRMLHFYQTLHTVWWWRQSLSVIRQCLIVDRGLQCVFSSDCGQRAWKIHCCCDGRHEICTANSPPSGTSPNINSAAGLSHGAFRCLLLLLPHVCIIFVLLLPCLYCLLFFLVVGSCGCRN